MEVAETEGDVLLQILVIVRLDTQEEIVKKVISICNFDNHIKSSISFEYRNKINHDNI